MNTERELTIDELDAVSGGAGSGQLCAADILVCAFLGVVGVAPPTSGGGLVHEPIHAN
jgi:hypothetical protein